MFSELTQLVRCVRDHPSTGLVAVSEEAVERDIRRGVLGCPRCGAQYPVRAGVIDFRLTPPEANAASPDTLHVALDGVSSATSGAGAEVPAEPGVAAGGAAIVDSGAGVDRDDVVRAGALLDLTTPGGLVVLTAEWGAIAPAIATLADRVQVLVINATARAAVGVTWAHAGEVPVLSGVARAVALDAPHVSPRWLESAVAALRPQGRLVAPAWVPLPGGVHELARDARHWVAERDATAPLVPLGVRRAP